MNYYNEIKNELIKNEITKKAKDYSKNKSDLNAYYNVGKLLKEAGKHYGEGVIKEYSLKLTKELSIKYTKSSLYNMLNFYKLNIKFQTVSGKLSWSHYCELLSIDDENKVIYYIKTTELQNLSVRELRNKIKNQEYERLDSSTKQKLINKEPNTLQDFIKNPILIKNSSNYKKISEKILKKLF